MRLLHFNRLKPVCPVCKQTPGISFPLEIRSAIKQNNDTIVEGILTCTNTQCRSEFPIIDNIPILVSDLRAYINQNILAIYGRTDISHSIETLVGDCCGPGSQFDTQRQQLSTYCHNHYSDCINDAGITGDSSGTVAEILAEGINQLAVPVGGPVIDMGCSVGRTTFELAKKSADITLGIDLNYSMLKIAQNILETGKANFSLRQSGLVYDQVKIATDFTDIDTIDFWVCDAANLPFHDGLFAFAHSMNLLDCVYSPHQHLHEIERILQESGHSLITTPYDWNANATPVEAWLGGHSQRTENRGAPDAIVRSMLTGNGNAGSLDQLRILFEKENIPWKLRLHKRSVMEYALHVFAVQKK